MTRNKDRLVQDLAQTEAQLQEMRADWETIQDENQAAKLIAALRRQLSAESEDSQNLRAELDECKRHAGHVTEQLESLRRQAASITSERDALAARFSKEQKKLKLRAELRGLEYPIGGRHWVDKVLDMGNYVLLEDSSLWRIGHESFRTTLWLPMHKITVIEGGQFSLYPYQLVNESRGDVVGATCVKR